MEKTTKKDFNELHKNNKLLLVAGMLKSNCKKTIQVLSGIDINQLKPIKTTNIDTGSQKNTGTIITIYKSFIQGKVFYIVETCINNSKNKYVSWNNIEYFSTVYIQK
jgi:hypothetical protein